MYPAEYGDNPLFPRSSNFQVVNLDDHFGLGVVTYRSFEPGETVAALAGQITSDVTQHSLQIEPGLHLLDLDFCGFFLHSCDPNVILDMKQMTVVARRPIHPKDYILMDYAQTEDVLFKQFWCQCGSENCRGWITGRLETPDENDSRYQEYLQSRQGVLSNPQQ